MATAPPFLFTFTHSLARSVSARCSKQTHGPYDAEIPPLNGQPLSSFKDENNLRLPPRPRRIILVRHGESEGNVDESAYTRTPDPRIALTETGKAQAESCGKAIRKIVEKDGAHDWKVFFYVSPYRRTVQTLHHLAKAFDKSRIAGMKEEPRLREQDFGNIFSNWLPWMFGYQLLNCVGNFQDREKMKVDKAIRLRYGRFYYRFANGESAADVYDRITGFRETLKADIDKGRFQPPGHRSPNMNLVIISHGLTLRVFLMRWYKWTIRQYEKLNNFRNAGFIVMEKGYGGRYSLLVHHTEQELRDFGLTTDMLMDQEWQKFALPGELNYDCPMMDAIFNYSDDEQSAS